MKTATRNAVYIFFTTILISSLCAQTVSKRTVAILDFNNNSIVDKEKLEPLRKGLSEILITEMSQIEAFNIVEREKLRELVTEQEFGQSEMVDQASAQKMGKLLGAQNLLFGAFVHSFGEKIRVDVRIVEVETGRTLRAVEETGDLEDIFDIVKELTKKISKQLKVEMTKEDLERQKSRSAADNFEATLAYSKAIDFEDLGRQYAKQAKSGDARSMYQKAVEFLKLTLNKSPKFKDAQEKLEELQAKLRELK